MKETENAKDTRDTKHSFIPDEDYKKIMEIMPIPTVDIVIFHPDKTKVLLFLRKNKPAQGYYYALGGRIHKGESLTESAMRKAKEELHLTLEENDLFFGGVIDEFFEDSRFDGVAMHSLNSFFGYVLGESAIWKFDTTQFEDAKWFDILDDKLHPFMKQKLDILKKIL